MFLESVRMVSSGVGQIFILGLIGFFLVKKHFLGHEGLDALSRLVIEVTLPLFIFSGLVKDFSFNIYPNWWIFPLLSLAITAIGLAAGALFSGFIKGDQHKPQFLALVSFQNSGYLPLALVAALVSADKLDSIFIYLFLFLLGFNLVIWSLGAYMLSAHKRRKFELGSLFSPPVIATIFSLVFIFLGLNRFIPQGILRPLRMAGDCTLPLAMFVVGGNLAQLQPRHIDLKVVILLILGKLIILPLLGLFVIIKFDLPELIGLLIILQLAMPSATSLSVIVRHYQKEDLLISQGVFFSHLASIITIPVFLSLYFTLRMLK